MLPELLNYQLPLWAYILLWAGLTAGIAWFAWLDGKATREKECAEQELQVMQEGLEAMDQESLKELDHDYSTLATLLEEQHQQIEDLHKYGDELEQRLACLEQRSRHIHIGISKLFQVCNDDDDYTGPDDDGYADDGNEGTVQTLPTPLSGWLDMAEGLDTL